MSVITVEVNKKSQVLGGGARLAEKLCEFLRLLE
jgi:hypothetical protein